MATTKKIVKPATRKQLIVWLANAIRFVPINLCTLAPYSMPPQWVKDAKRELKRNGITFKK
jgi:hypothetical protein